MINDSIQGITNRVKRCTDAVELQQALKAEQERGNPRKTVVKLIEARIKALGKKQPVKEAKTAQVEVVGADWTEARQIFDRLKIHLRLGLAGQVLLGAELQRLKKELGFTHGGKRKKASCQSGNLKTWKEHMAQEMPDLPWRTADRFIQLADGARNKLKKLGQTKALALFDKPGSELDDAQQDQLRRFTTNICFGETQASILEDLKMARGPKKPPKSNAEPSDEDEDAPIPDDQLAFAFFGSPFKTFVGLRYEKHYEHYLSAMPLHGNPDEETVGLVEMEQHLAEALEDIKKTIKSKTSRS